MGVANAHWPRAPGAALLPMLLYSTKHDERRWDHHSRPLPEQARNFGRRRLSACVAGDGSDRSVVGKPRARGRWRGRVVAARRGVVKPPADIGVKRRRREIGTEKRHKCLRYCAAAARCDARQQAQVGKRSRVEVMSGSDEWWSWWRAAEGVVRGAQGDDAHLQTGAGAGAEPSMGDMLNGGRKTFRRWQGNTCQHTSQCSGASSLVGVHVEGQRWRRGGGEAGMDGGTTVTVCTFTTPQQRAWGQRPLVRAGRHSGPIPARGR